VGTGTQCINVELDDKAPIAGICQLGSKGHIPQFERRPLQNSNEPVFYLPSILFLWTEPAAWSKAEGTREKRETNSR